MKHRLLAQRLLAWYDRNARNLPWRGQPDAYRVWVSEIMLQQTRVDTVVPYFERWIQRFPTLADLAGASEQEVLQLWEGLGYYSRARNLLKAARQVIEQHQGQIPSTREELEKLPGIGRYTAAAIASIAFGRREAALDGNIRRVLARLFDIQAPARSPEGERLLWKLAMDHLPLEQAGDFNQALMDLGAVICTPQAPRCSQCPLAELCLARAAGVQEQRPIRKAHPAIPCYLVTAAVIKRNGTVLIARRPENGLLGGLWEFPGGKVEEGEDLPAALRREIQEELGVAIAVGESVGIYQHAYTHFRVRLHAFRCRLSAGEPAPLQASELRWVTLNQLRQYPMGKIDRRIAEDITNIKPKLALQ